MPFNLSGNGPIVSPSTLQYAGGSPKALIKFTSNTSSGGDLCVGDFCVTNGAVYTSNNYRIFCKNLILNNGRITCNGGNASGSTRGTAIGRGSLGAGGSGGNGATFVASVHIPAVSGEGSDGGCLGGSGGAGQTTQYDAGGTPAYSTAGGSGRSRWIPFSDSGTDYMGGAYQPLVFSSGIAAKTTHVSGVFGSTTYSVSGGCGGGGGGGVGRNPADGNVGGYAGGGGGGGGGVVHITCSGVIHLMNGSSIASVGGNGGNGVTYSTYAGGGGGGGGGGVIIITCQGIHMDSSSYLAVSGGNPGTIGSQIGEYVPVAGETGRILILTPSGVFDNGLIASTRPGVIIGSDYPNIPTF